IIKPAIFQSEISRITDDFIPPKDIVSINSSLINSQKISPINDILKQSTNDDRDINHVSNNKIDELQTSLNNTNKEVISTDLVKVVHSKQEMISQLEQKLGETEQKYQHLVVQFKQGDLQLKYENERKENLLLRGKLVELEGKLFDSDRRSQILSELKLEVDQMQQVFDNLEKENNQLNEQLLKLKDDHSTLEEDYKTAQMKLSLANKQV
ncbi:unnamed protein product, partial [Didymodactylos carnosus]